jgi:UDP-glucose-4-epimerase GalE
MSYILVTGGLGYIGSHICLGLLQNNFKLVILDSLVNSSYDVLSRIQLISGKSINNEIIFYKDDIRNNLNYVFKKHKITLVIHLAALKSVYESQTYSKLYYDVNVTGTQNLLNHMINNNVTNIIFSSTAAVYNEEVVLGGYTEDSKININNIKSNYGKTKFINEEQLRQLYDYHKNMCIIILRFFNPIGNHDSLDPPLGGSLYSNILKVINKQQKFLEVYGNTYKTLDGTCIRDYISIFDLVDCHLYLISKINYYGFYTYNVGTGNGKTVLELINAISKKTGRNIPFVIKERRNGDLPVSFANVDKIKNELGWVSTRDLI